MTDRITSAETASAPVSGDRGSLFRPALWLLLIISAVINVTMSIVGASAIIGGGFGLISLTCVVVLIVHHYRHRA